MKLRSILLGAAAISALSGSVAHAQDQDVLVMRRAVAPAKDPNALQPVEGADLNGYYWVTSSWIRGEPSCSEEAEQTRLRGCVYQGKQANEANCPQPAPETTRLVEDRRACEYEWTATATGPWAETCSETTRPVTSECRRQDGTPVDDIYCSGQAKPSEIKGFNEEGCTYAWAIGEWGNWKSACSAETSRERKVECVRSNGSTAPDAFCGADKPDVSEPGENYSNCTFRWEPTEWVPDEPKCAEVVRQTRTASCKRIDGQSADESECLDPLPLLEQVEMDYGACSHSWDASEWTAWSSTCSTQARRTRTVSCLREDGKVVQKDNCEGSEPPKEQTDSILSGCSFEWNTGDWETTPACSAEAESTRIVDCRRTDGLLVDDSNCDPSARPTDARTVAEYSNCTYSWSTTPTQWDSTCSAAANGTRTVTCRRSDGKEAPEYQCDLSRRPSEALTEANYEGCPTQWAEGEWSDWNSQCSDSSKRTRLVQCAQTRPTETVIVPMGNCSNDEMPNKEETSAIYSGCVADWTETSWGWNGQVGAKSSTCSATPKQQREVTCRKRSAPDGNFVTLDDAECSEPKPTTEKTLSADYDGCTYEWSTGPWGDWDSLCSANARRTRTVQCLRKDGSNTLVAPGNCDPDHPDAQSEQIEEVVINCGGVIKNGDFEEGFSEWDANVYAQITDDSYSGNNAALLSSGSARLYQSFPETIQAGQTINVAFHCKRLGRFSGMKFSIRNKGGAAFRQDTVMDCSEGYWTENRFSIPVNVTTDLEVWTFAPSSSSSYSTIIDNIIVTVN